MLDLSLETFDNLDEDQLRLVINQVARRMLILRCTTPDVAFWHSALMRVNKWLGSTPAVNEIEEKYLTSPAENTSGRVRAIRHMRERSGMQMAAVKEIIDAWIKENLSIVHESVKNSYLTGIKRANAT